MWNLKLTQVTDPSLAYIVLGGFVVAFSTISLLVKEKLYMNEVVLGTGFGVLMGPYCANIFDPRSWAGDTNKITLEVMRIVLATGLFAIGVELPQSYMADHAKGLLVMVVPTMAFGWIIVATLVYVLFPPLNFISALVIAACLTPTDPIICATIVGGKFAIKHVPTNLRRILAAESAANDGLAYPFLSISLYLTLEASTGTAFGKWFVVGWLYQVIMGTVIGALLGLGFSKLMKLAHRHGLIDRESYVAQYLALAVFTTGVVSTIGSDDLLAAFAAGSAISWDGHFNIQTENEVFSSVIDLVLNCGCFVYIGAWLPFPSFNTPELGILPWRLVVLFLAILVLRRIPAMLLLYRWIPEISGWKEALFSGHFGPMGVGAMFVSTLAVSRLPQPQSPPQNQQEYLAASLQTIVSFVILGSILIHGLSIPFFSFGRRIHSTTVTMSRTWTRTAPLPDWLLGTRPLPADASTAVISPGGTLTSRDVETALRDDSQKVLAHPAAVHFTQAADAEAPVLPQHEADRGHIAHLGVAAMLQDSPDESTAEVNGGSLRRRYANASGEDMSVTPPSDVASENDKSGKHSRESSADMAASVAAKLYIPSDRPYTGILARRTTPDDEDGESHSGMQTPVKTVRFPSDQ